MVRKKLNDPAQQDLFSILGDDTGEQPGDSADRARGVQPVSAPDTGRARSVPGDGGRTAERPGRGAGRADGGAVDQRLADTDRAISGRHDQDRAAQHGQIIGAGDRAAAGALREAATGSAGASRSGPGDGTGAGSTAVGSALDPDRVPNRTRRDVGGPGRDGVAGPGVLGGVPDQGRVPAGRPGRGRPAATQPAGRGTRDITGDPGVRRPEKRRPARAVEGQPSLFDAPEPTDPRTIDPGGTPLPAPTRAPAATEPIPAVLAGPAEAARADEPGDQPLTAPTADPTLRLTIESFGTPTDFPASTEVLAPSGAKARARANIAVLECLAVLRESGRPATLPEQQILAAWSGWGALPGVFDKRDEKFDAERARVRELLTDEQYRAAEASILNAHYTDPALAAVIWDALGAAGFSGGRVLEPGCGSGTFINHAPESAVMVGVENDPLTAEVAAALYPSAQIRREGFEETRVPENSFALTVGNVPFGDFSVYDPAHNPGRHSIHNHFILKSLALTAPGGYVAVLTSRYTMDAANSRARKDMAAIADLVAAIRLPAKAFSRVAGTDVVTDLLILRRRDPAATEQETPNWLDTSDIELFNPVLDDYEGIGVNDYFRDHPENVLGTMRWGQGIHGSTQLDVDGATGAELAEQLRARLSSTVSEAVTNGLGLSATAEDLTTVDESTFDAGLISATDRGEDTPLYTLRYNPTRRGIDYWDGHRWQPNTTPKTLVAETRQLIGLRDTALSLIASQRDGQPQSERDQLRGHLNHLYDTYVATYGPVNRFTWVHPKEPDQAAHDKKMAALEAAWRRSVSTKNSRYTGPAPAELREQWDQDAWEAPAPYKKRRHLDGGMRHDPGWAVVASLEIFDEHTGKARKAEIFSTDLLVAAVDKVSADTPEEALAISLDRTGRVDMALISTLLGVDHEDARALVDGLVYPDLDDPAELTPASVALSGDVRAKLERALIAAQINPAYSGYVAALREVMPIDRQASEIKVRPGASWIPATVVAQFARETFGADDLIVEHHAGRWVLEMPKWERTGSLMRETWGMRHDGTDAVSLLEAACNSRSVVINDKEGVLDAEATFAAQAKTAKITEEFARWIFADEQRAQPLVAEYNRRFNSLRAPRHDGSHLQLPGLSTHFVPHPYQRNAVARVLSEPTTLLDHVVGAGKSGSMIMSAMELRRLGLVRQPWIVVPNHILEQIGREAKQWYPAANILLGTSATDPDGRRRLIAQSASTDWDMVIISQSAFTAISVSKEIQAEHIAEQLDSLRHQLEQAEAVRTKKAIERALKAAKERLTALSDQQSKDHGLRFEDCGADYVFVDEAHLYKNKARICNIEELSCPTGAQRAEDLAMKLRVLRERRRHEARAAGIADDKIVERVATFATGTPIANSLGELWVMQAYLRLQLLEAAGVADLGDWGATFTDTITTIEVNATGTKLRPVTRVGKYVNLPELLALTNVYTDVVTRDQVPVPLPELVGGGRRVVTIPPSVEVSDFIADLGHRADNLDPKKPERDNILKIANDGRNASLDPRLAHLDPPPITRASVVADEIMRIHITHADRIYRDADTGIDQDLPGGFQIVFCDRGTPSKDPRQFTIYRAIKDELIARGMPAEKIRFIHEAKKPSDLAALRAQCTRGEVSVLIGSTEKMGTGTNVQSRAVALHHVDVPWRPADLEQREGRIIRQGNQNERVEILNYVTEGTYDTVMWQKVEAKALFIEQMRRNEVVDTEIEDLSGGDIGAAAAETKAIATGDPRYLRQVELDDAVRRLSALERAHHDAVRHRDYQVKTLEQSIPRQQRIVDELAPIAAEAASGKAAEITVDGRGFPDRPAAARAAFTACQKAFTAGRAISAFDFQPTGIAVAGHEVLAARSLTNDVLRVRLSVPSETKDIERAELLPTAGGEESGHKLSGLLKRLENLYTNLPHHHQQLQQRLQADHDDLSDHLDHPPGPFEHAHELATTEAEFRALTLELQLAADSPEARAKREAADRRLAERGRKPGWSLMRNPTPCLLEETGFRTADDLRSAIRTHEEITMRRARGLDNGPGLEL